MVNSYKTLLADGSITAAGRPQSANSRKRIDTAAESTSAIKVYSNNLFNDGDILAAEAVQAASIAPLPSTPSKMAGNQKFQQQRAMAAQKRLERLQLGGVAQSNEGAIAVLQVHSKPGTPGPTKASTLAGTTSNVSAGQSMTTPGSFPTGMHKAISTHSMGETSAMPIPTSLSEPWEGQGRPSSAERTLAAKGLATVYDPNQDTDTAGTEAEEPLAIVKPGMLRASGSTKLYQPVPGARLDLSDMAAFVLRPGPRTGPVLCYIERDKGGVGRPPCYRMHMDEGRTFLLAARKRVKSASSHYVISTSSDDLSRSSSSYIGKLKANFVGTEFSIHCKATTFSSATAKGSLAVSSSNGRYSSRKDLETKANEDNGTPEPIMQEVGAVVFGYNVLGTRGPRKMMAAVPAVLGPDGSHRWRSTGADDTILERLKNQNCGDQITVLKNKNPKWNDALNAYCLNFGGRVTEASVKNFQLVTESDPDIVVLQFGKVSDTCFTCDFMWPLSPLQALCICLSSFDNKLACE